MGKYFGTDGIRGEVNKTLTAKLAYKVGEYLGYYCTSNNLTPKIIIGRDTRLSSAMLENAIAAGASSTGVSSYIISDCPTPCVSYNVTLSDYTFGVMISASHNPYYDNGIKIFNHQGTKLSADIENEIEDYIDGKKEITLCNNENIGKIVPYTYALDLYIDNLVKMFDLDLTGLNLLIDCANGSATYTALRTFERLNANCTMLFDKPDGLNINRNCGSTHIEKLVEHLSNGNYDLGLSFDGDADRLIAVAPNGRIIDGDHILYILGTYMLEHKQLNKNMVVTTVMANVGLIKALKEHNVEYIKTPVGDKYVFEQLNNHNYSLGGEQSGHIILPEYAVSGDGLLTALKLIEVIKKTNKDVLTLVNDLTIYPQLLVNVKVNDKNLALTDKELNDLVDSIALELKEDGQILVRPSGTESLVRVMVEAKTDDICKEYVNKVVEFIKEKKY